jgi:2-polyprenyl-3-methyl-5-hydroxy-6-metoxy-1,4-benzoquinol methylase
LKTNSEIAEDFNAIADALRSTASRRTPTAAERAVLAAIPHDARLGLDCGCGDGSLAEAAARRGLQMIGIDLAPQMIALAESRAEPSLQIDFRVADIMTVSLAPASFDVVISVNVVHHLPLEAILPRLAALVAPGGRLIIQDVVTRNGLRYLPINGIAAILGRLRRVGRRKAHSPAVQRLYDQHGIGETYLRPEHVSTALAPFLPGVSITHHLDWRYTAIWTRPPALFQPDEAS